MPFDVEYMLSTSTYVHNKFDKTHAYVPYCNRKKVKKYMENKEKKLKVGSLFQKISSSSNYDLIRNLM